ncbi:MAG: phosphatidylglycerophosphatase A [Candidatus Omnitrophica bacterium]|nr:phosphatidylglycerophosphatase A [Candidatus Omnitrophota bacterium]
MQKRITKGILTVFGIGYLPLAPGTFASVVAVLFYFVIRNNLFLYLTSTAFLIIIGFVVSRDAEKIFKEKDPKEVVIDEFCGMLVAYMLVPFTTPNVIWGFIIFRIFDILKVYPLERLERLKKGRGIMLDDLAAGVLTNILLQVMSFIRF